MDGAAGVADMARQGVAGRNPQLTGAPQALQKFIAGSMPSF
jgi:hypothetical protein